MVEIEEDPIETAWARVDADWDNPDVHRKFIGLCASLDRLAEAGARYRAVREQDNDRSEAARAHIDKLMGVAMQSLLVLKTEPRKGPPLLLKMIALLVFVGLIGAALFFILFPTNFVR